MNFKNTYKDSLRSDYYISTRRLGAPTSIQDINQISEMTKRLNEGMHNVEIGVLDVGAFEQIPSTHFKEMRQMAKLTGAKVSVHAPIQGVDLAGFASSQGGGLRWNEDHQKETAIRMKNVFERAHELDPTGNTPVVMHVTGGVPSFEWQKGFISDEDKRNLKPGGQKEFPKTIIGFDQEAKQLVPMEYEKKEYIRGTREFTPEKRMESYNETKWDKEKLEIMSHQKTKDELEWRYNQTQQRMQPLLQGYRAGVLTEEEEGELEAQDRNLQALKSHMQELDQTLHSELNELHHKYKKFGGLDKDTEKALQELKERIQQEERMLPQIQKLVRANQAEEVLKLQKKFHVDSVEMLGVLGNLPTPKQVIPVEEFAKKKTAETVSDIMAASYKKYGKNTPILALENYLPELVGGRAENLKAIVLESRKAFENKLVKEQKLSQKEAETIARKLIGVTWDVGHISFLKKAGYDDADILKEAEKIGPYVKHLHVTDNFGYSDSHLPPGLGTVNIKEQLKMIEQKLAAEGVSQKDMPRAIVEAGAFAAGFKTSPQPYALESLNSPVSELYRDIRWGSVGDMVGSYMMGYGDILPEQHFQSLYGSGFSQLPRELGGQMGNERSRFSGTPNE